MGVGVDVPKRGCTPGVGEVVVRNYPSNFNRKKIISWLDYFYILVGDHTR